MSDARQEGMPAPGGPVPGGPEPGGSGPGGPGPGDPARAAALRTLEPFARRLLPGLLRRLLGWRGFTEHARHDLRLDLEQELRLDCLLHAEAILRLPPRSRHQRWFRLVERWVYRQRLRSQPTLDDVEPAAPTATADPAPTAENLRALLPDAPTPLLERLARDARRHRNGRCNLGATASVLGVHRRHVRRYWERAAARLGYGDEFLAFWRRRLAEALTGLAADLLRDDGSVHLLARPRPRPDPEGRLRRIRRIHGILRVRPLPVDLRRALAPLLRRADPRALPPRALLALAQDLAPDCAAVALWQFEAALADARPDLAARAVRRARPLGADPVATALARARLLQVRGRPGAARGCLLAAAARHRDDRPLRALAAGARTPRWPAAAAEPSDRERYAP